LLDAASKLRRSVLPSMATTCPAVISCSAVIQLNRHRSNSAGTSAASTALNRSCDGMPFDKSRNCSSHFRFCRPHSAMETKSSAPATIAQTAMVTMLTSGDVTFRRRGSVNERK
jgi:hypothetical protein